MATLEALNGRFRIDTQLGDIKSLFGRLGTICRAAARLRAVVRAA